MADRGDPADPVGRRMSAEELLDRFAVALLSVSTDGRILAWNRAAEALLGYTSAEAVGASLFELIVPDPVGDDLAARMWSLAAGESATYDSVRRRKDGVLVDVEVTMRAVPGDDGSVSSFAIALRDVGDARRRRAAEQAA